MTLITLDIETECGIGCEEKCSHALDLNRNRVTCVGVLVETDGEIVHRGVYRDLSALQHDLSLWPDAVLVGHNIIGFDLKILKRKGVDLTALETHDTQLMLLAFTEKVSSEYLEWYEEERKRLNKLLPRGESHREAGRYSLKTSAPYFIGVSPFWENTSNKDDDEYVMRDVVHTRDLCSFLIPLLKKEGTYEFYQKKLIPWARMLMEAEYEGISLDLKKVSELEERAKREASAASARLDQLWAEGFNAYLREQRRALETAYGEKLDRALSRLKYPTIKDAAKAASRHQEKIQRTRARYQELLATKISELEPLNLDSPTQLTWLLKEYLGYDIVDYNNEETTGIEVLERLAAEGKKDVETFIEYRGQQKLCSAFFPSYKEMQFKGKLHCNFNINGTRTGRLSSSTPNLQQVPGHLHEIFVAKAGHSLITRDESGIEPVVVAYFSQDPILCDLLMRGGNFHSFNTPAFFDYVQCAEHEVKRLFARERDLAKTIGLALMYGASWRRIQIAAMKAGFRWSKEECQYKYEKFKELYEHTFRFKEETLDPLLLGGATVTNLFGRKFKLSPDEVHMKGLNTLVQSSASDLVLQSAYKINTRMKAAGISGGVRLLVHDELVVEAEDERLKEAEEIVEHAMTTYTLPTPYGNLPLKVEGKTGKAWAK